MRTIGSNAFSVSLVAGSNFIVYFFFYFTETNAQAEPFLTVHMLYPLKKALNELRSQGALESEFLLFQRLKSGTFAEIINVLESPLCSKAAICLPETELRRMIKRSMAH